MKKKTYLEHLCGLLYTNNNEVYFSQLRLARNILAPHYIHSLNTFTLVWFVDFT